VVEFLERGRLELALDLRGAEIGIDPLAEFRLLGMDYSGLDMSFGRGALIVHGGSVTDLNAEGFQFDRASHLMKTAMRDCSFAGSRGRFGASDVTFLRCDFSRSEFRGGFNDYGFTRCTFQNCQLTDAVWSNGYFKACRFLNCSLVGARFHKALVSGVRLSGVREWQSLLVDCDVRSLYLNEVQIVHGNRAV